jgi:glycine/D-amino acid oxidase-like deaminating enzyme
MRNGFGADRLRGARIVVIGGGVVGAALGYRLGQAGGQVTVVERNYAGSGTSGNSFAWLNGFSKPPRHYHRLNIMSIRDHQDLADEIGGTWAHVDGGIHWEPDDQIVQADNMRRDVGRLREWGVRVDQTTPEIAMRELEPDLWIDPERVSTVYVVPREGWLEAVTMAHRVLHAAVTRYGVCCERGTVSGFSGPDAAVTGVVLDDGRELPADVVINAAGPEAASVAALAGADLQLDRQIGMFFSTAPAPVCLKHVVYGSTARMRPDGNSRVVVHPEYLDSCAVEGQVTSVTDPVVQRARDEAQSVLPGLAGVPVEAIRVGMRPMPRDGHPIVGFDPRISGLYTVVTHSGITLSARLALLVTEELSGGEPADLEPYRPSRFGAEAVSQSSR